MVSDSNFISQEAGTRNIETFRFRILYYLEWWFIISGTINFGSHNDRRHRSVDCRANINIQFRFIVCTLYTNFFFANKTKEINYNSRMSYSHNSWALYSCMPTTMQIQVLLCLCCINVYIWRSHIKYTKT